MRRVWVIDRWLFLFFPLIFCSIVSPRTCPSITIDEAISLAVQTLPSFAASKYRVDSTADLYSASLSPYLPSLDASTSQEYHSTEQEDFGLSNYDVALSYTLFDGGRRRADRNIAGYNLDISREELDKNLLDLEFNVKSAFYTLMAQKEILNQREVQLENTQKDYEVARGRHKFGVARLSDVLQASVRLEQAKFNLVEAEGDLNKALSDFNSLVGRPLGTHYDLEGSLPLSLALPDREVLVSATLDRPEIKQSEDLLQISKNNKKLETSAFFPLITANASYSKSEGGPFGGLSAEDSSIALRVTWNIFELGKFYRTKSASFEIRVSRENLRETVRQLLLDEDKAYQDVITASKNILVATEQLRQAEQNYSQAFGEYKVGKGDILALVLAEGLLSVAREQLVSSKLNLILSKSFLERVAGVDKLESLVP